MHTEVLKFQRILNSRISTYSCLVFFLQELFDDRFCETLGGIEIISFLYINLPVHFNIYFERKKKNWELFSRDSHTCEFRMVETFWTQDCNFLSWVIIISMMNMESEISNWKIEMFLQSTKPEHEVIKSFFFNFIYDIDRKKSFNPLIFWWELDPVIGIR